MKDITQTNRSLLVSQAINSFPYFVLRQEMKTGYNDYTKEMRDIKANYINYKKGAEFITEGASGDYLPSDVLFKNMKVLIDKQARYMFSQTPTVEINNADVGEENKKQLETYQGIINKVISKSKFSEKVLEASRDSLIGKRVAGVVDFSERDGARIHFYDSLQFYYETEYGEDRLTKFVTFENVTESKTTTKRVFLVNRYEVVNDVVYMSSTLFDGAGNVLEELIPNTKTALTEIPAVVIFNSGLLSDKRGVSDIDELLDFDSVYSLLANSDVDSLRKGMNPVRYTVDMNSESTSNLSSSAGSFWDLQHNDNMNDPKPQVGVLAPQLNHTEPVKVTTERIKTMMYSLVDVPNITEETMVGTITSGKALEVLYFPLTVRCNEKMKTWIPALEFLFETAMNFVILNKDLCEDIYNVAELSDMEYNIVVKPQYALLKDEREEKELDIEEINANVRSRKSYMRKYRADELTTEEKIDEELMQIAVELNMFDTMSMNTQVSGELDNRTAEDDSKEGIDETKTEEELEDLEV